MSFDAEKIKSDNDIVRVISHYVPLKKRGAEYLGLCPFHDDHNPSFMVNPVKRVAKCFSCGWGGEDVIGFVQEIEGITFQAACEKLGGSNNWSPMVTVNKAPPLPDRVTMKPPPDAGRPDMKIRLLGDAIKYYTFRDVDGSTICFEARYDDPKDKARMWTWGSREGRIPKWECGHPTVPRPLYGLHRIRMHSPDKQMLITEGAKKADAAQALIGKHYVCLSWSGGSKAWSRHDWTRVRGVKVLLWPDADEQRVKTEAEAKKYEREKGDIIPYRFQPGQMAMLNLAVQLTNQKCTVRILDVTGMPPAWDAHDAVVAKWDQAKFIEWATPRAHDFKQKELPPEHTIINPDGEPSTTQNNYVPPEADEKSGLVKKLKTHCMSDVVMQNITWLWKDKIAQGKMTLLAGDPGLGKSQITAAMIAVVTTGGLWPGDRSKCEQGSCIILSIEDDPSDTIKPRLAAAGARMDKVHQVTSTLVRDDGGEYEDKSFSLHDDMKPLEELINRLGDVRLVIVDPLSAYMDKVDTHNNQETRGALLPLIDLCERKRFACVLVSHLTKNSKAPFMQRVQGSVAFVAVARAVFGVIKDPENPERRYFLPAKNNVSIDKYGLTFKIEGYSVQQPKASREEDMQIETSRVVWDAEIVERSIDEHTADGFLGDDGDTIKDVKQFIEETLEMGEVWGIAVMKVGLDEGFAKITVRRAAKKMGVVMRKVGGGDGSKTYWSLPDDFFKKRNRLRSFSED